MLYEVTYYRTISTKLAVKVALRFLYKALYDLDLNA